MTDVIEPGMQIHSEQVTADDGRLELMRAPFPAHQISKMSRGNVQLDYVGHAALTDRLLDVDPSWNWEPLAIDGVGLPKFDSNGGLWIRLTVCGVTRLGYGNAKEKGTNFAPGDREKEVIGDALRNAAMRFGAALDLWHKGDLHKDDNGGGPPIPEPEPVQALPTDPEITKRLETCLSQSSLQHEFGKLTPDQRRAHYQIFDAMKTKLSPRPIAPYDPPL